MRENRANKCAKYIKGQPKAYEHSRGHTYEAEADFGLPQRGAASHQTEDEHHHADADDDRRWDQCVLVLDEAVKVVVALDHIGTDVGQRRSCNLRGGELMLHIKALKLTGDKLALWFGFNTSSHRPECFSMS